MIGSDPGFSLPKTDPSPSRPGLPLRMRLRRALWQAVGVPVVCHAPRWLGFLRFWLLRNAGAHLGARCVILRGMKVLNPPNLALEDGVVIGPHVEFYNHDMIHVRARTEIGQYTFLCTCGHDYSQPELPPRYAEIEVGADCRIAAGAFIGPGVTIGDGCIIEAHSVVLKDMPARMVCAGNPCHPLRPRTAKDAESAAAEHSAHEVR